MDMIYIVLCVQCAQLARIGDCGVKSIMESSICHIRMLVYYYLTRKVTRETIPVKTFIGHSKLGSKFIATFFEVTDFCHFFSYHRGF